MAAFRRLDSLIPSRTARRLWLPVGLSLVVAGLLLHGALRPQDVAPANAPATPSPSPTPTTAPFRPELEKVPLMYFSDYWLQLAQRAQEGLVTLGRSRIPAVRVRPGSALTTTFGADVVVAEPAEASEGSFVAGDARQGVALFHLSPDAQAEPLALATGLRPGSLLAVVSLVPEEGLQVTPATLASTPSDSRDDLEVTCSYPPSMDIGAIVDLDGNLAGVALRTPRGVRALRARAAGSLADRLAAVPVCRGIEVSPLSPEVRAGLRLSGGVLVGRVFAEAFPTAPDLRAGDVLLKWGEKELARPEDFQLAYDSLAPGRMASFVARRGGRRVTGEAETPGPDGRPAAMTPREIPWLGVVARWTRGDPQEPASPGLLVLHVPDGGPGAAAGLEVGDVVTQVNGRPLTWPAARPFLQGDARPRRALLAVTRDHTLRLAALPAGEE